MSRLDRRFFVGLAAGCALSLVVAAVGGGLLLFAMDRLVPTLIRGALAKVPPTFPEPDALPAMGFPDPAYGLRDLEGNRVILGEFAGRPVFLNYWATWCPPCVAELPAIDRLRDQVGDRAAFVLISEEPVDVVRAFVAENGIRAPVYVTDDPRPRAFAEPGIPLTFVLDRDGTVVFRHRGIAAWDGGDCRDFLLAIP